MKLVDVATDRRVTIVMFTFAIILFGFVSLSRLKVNLLPDLSYPTITIRTELTGAAPMEVENLLTKPIEESVGVIKNVRTLGSLNSCGFSPLGLLTFFFNFGVTLVDRLLSSLSDSSLSSVRQFPWLAS